jgi:hypothetical protein
MKYYGVIGLAALAATIGIGWQVLAPGKSSTVIEPVEQANNDTAALDRDLVRTQLLAASLDSIAASAFEPRTTAPVIAFTRTAAGSDPSALANALGVDGDDPVYKREVSLLYSGRGFNRAVVDGKYVRRGARLPDGSKVLNITRDTVVIKTAEGREVLRVPDPRTAPKPAQKGNLK